MWVDHCDLNRGGWWGESRRTRKGTRRTIPILERANTEKGERMGSDKKEGGQNGTIVFSDDGILVRYLFAQVSEPRVTVVLRPQGRDGERTAVPGCERAKQAMRRGWRTNEP